MFSSSIFYFGLVLSENSHILYCYYLDEAQDKQTSVLYIGEQKIQNASGHYQ